MIRIIAFVFISLTLALPSAAWADKITVVTSFSILGDMVKQIAGDNVTLVTLVGANGDAHAYEATPADAQAISNAKLVIVNGLGFEPWVDRLVKSASYRGDTVTATEGVIPIMNGKIPDPHAWQSIKNGRLYVINIASALGKADPKNAKVYSTNAANYLRTLSVIDEWVRTSIEKVPTNKRRAITSHDSLHYFAQAYHVQFISPLGATTSNDASAYYIAQLIDLMRRKEVRAAFIENMTDPRIVQQLVTDGNGFMGGKLYTDALSQADGPAPTYTEMFHYNVTTLVQAMLQN